MLLSDCLGVALRLVEVERRLDLRGATLAAAWLNAAGAAIRTSAFMGHSAVTRTQSFVVATKQLRKILISEWFMTRRNLTLLFMDIIPLSGCVASHCVDVRNRQSERFCDQIDSQSQRCTGEPIDNSEIPGHTLVYELESLHSTALLKRNARTDI